MDYRGERMYGFSLACMQLLCKGIKTCQKWVGLFLNRILAIPFLMKFLTSNRVKYHSADTVLYSLSNSASRHRWEHSMLKTQLATSPGSHWWSEEPRTSKDDEKSQRGGSGVCVNPTSGSLPTILFL